MSRVGNGRFAPEYAKQGLVRAMGADVLLGICHFFLRLFISDVSEDSIILEKAVG